MLGDGECEEGSVWEAALFANHFHLENLVAIVDHNHMQSLDNCENTLKLEDFVAKWRSFNWEVREINGNDHDDLRATLKDTSTAHHPMVVIANTTKGKGVSFMENDIKNIPIETKDNNTYMISDTTNNLITILDIPALGKIPG